MGTCFEDLKRAEEKGKEKALCMPVKQAAALMIYQRYSTAVIRTMNPLDSEKQHRSQDLHFCSRRAAATFEGDVCNPCS